MEKVSANDKQYFLPGSTRGPLNEIEWHLTPALRLFFLLFRAVALSTPSPTLLLPLFVPCYSFVHASLAYTPCLFFQLFLSPVPRFFLLFHRSSFLWPTKVTARGKSELRRLAIVRGMDAEYWTINIKVRGMKIIKCTHIQRFRKLLKIVLKITID